MFQVANMHRDLPTFIDTCSLLNLKDNANVELYRVLKEDSVMTTSLFEFKATTTNSNSIMKLVKKSLLAAVQYIKGCLYADHNANVNREAEAM